MQKLLTELIRALGKKGRKILWRKIGASYFPQIRRTWI